MKIAYFDCSSGLSGDMALAACIDAGVSSEDVQRTIEALGLPHCRLRANEVYRSHIRALQIAITQSGEGVKQLPNYAAFAALVEKAAVSESVKTRTLRALRRLTEAEARLHGAQFDDVHFHEVGRVDTLIAIACTAACLEALGVEQVFSNPLRVGNVGTIRSSHGTIPLPAPATLEILKRYPLQMTNVSYELTTPTGAANIAAYSEGVMDPARPFVVESIGYGAGMKEYPGFPGFVRVLIGDLQ